MSTAEKFRKKVRQHKDSIEDWTYLIHHIHTGKDGKETVHNCDMLDHLGNQYEVKQVEDKKGKFRHCLVGLKEDQKVYWNDEEAKDAGQKVPCANRQLACS